MLNREGAPDHCSRESEGSRDSGPRSPLRTVQVLEQLASSPEGIPLAELADRLALPKTSVFRLLRSLESGGYVRSRGGVHQLGPEAVRLGMLILRHRELPNTARSAMEWLSEESGETIVLGIIDDTSTHVIYSDVIEGTNPLRFTVKVGTTKPLYCSASGLAIIAYMEQAELQRYLADVRFVRFAPRTISSVAALKRKIREIRLNGVAVSVGGTHEDVFAIGAPIMDAKGSVRSAFSISAPSTRGAQQADRFAALLLKAARDVSRLIGYSGDYPVRR